MYREGLQWCFRVYVILGWWWFETFLKSSKSIRLGHSSAAFIILSFEGSQSRRSLVELAATAGLQEGFSVFFEQEAKQFI